MPVEIIEFVYKRKMAYEITEDMLFDVISAPDDILQGYWGRQVYQKRLNGYVLRIIVEAHKNIISVITLYKARSARYET